MNKFKSEDQYILLGLQTPLLHDSLGPQALVLQRLTQSVPTHDQPKGQSESVLNLHFFPTLV